MTIQKGITINLQNFSKHWLLIIVSFLAKCIPFQWKLVLALQLPYEIYCKAQVCHKVKHGKHAAMMEWWCIKARCSHQSFVLQLQFLYRPQEVGCQLKLVYFILHVVLFSSLSTTTSMLKPWFGRPHLNIWIMKNTSDITKYTHTNIKHY